MSDIKLDYDTHDLVIEDRDLQLITGSDLVRQRMKQRYWYFNGEWYLNTTEGVPYFTDILVKNPSRARVEALMKSVAAETHGVSRLNSFDMDYATATRQLTVRVSSQADDDIIELELQV